MRTLGARQRSVLDNTKPPAEVVFLRPDMQRNTTTQKVLDYVTAHSGCTSIQIIEATGVNKRDVHKALANLRLGQKIYTRNPGFKPAEYTTELPGVYADQPRPAKVVKKPASNLFDRPAYEGKELAPYTGRPNANDHKECGSMVGGVWHPYKPPGLMCVGAAGPVSLPAGQRRFAS